MKKESKKTNKQNVVRTMKITTIIFLIILISMIAFLGIYEQDRGQIVNTVKDYTYSMSIDGARNIKLQLDTSTKEIIKDSEGNIISEATEEEIKEKGYIKENIPNNSEESKTIDNYKKAKKIIERRLMYLGVQEHNVSLNTKTGEIEIKVPENLRTDTIVSNLIPIGKFEIIDTDTKEVLLDNSHIKSSDVLYSNTQSGTVVYLEMVFNKQGKKKLEEISKTYIKEENNNTVEENTTENNTNNTQTNEALSNKTITMKIDDEEIMKTSFEDVNETGKLQLTVGTATTNTATLEGYISQAQNVATALNNGNLPLQYRIAKNEYIMSDITKQDLLNVEIVIAIAILVGIVILIAKYKINGLIAGISYVGLAALYMLVIRYTNVIISIESIFGIEIILVLNYILTFMLLNKIENRENSVNKSIIDVYTKFFNRLIPVCIMAIVFCFAEWIPISSFGMILFWGIIMIATYNTIITRELLRIRMEDK